jgi:flavin reductase (DIM6/NTAB) family NADH-FMN oxidoreductase RutF
VFYELDEHGGGERPPELAWDPFKAIVAPRPIGWITTLSPEGVVNLAPYSFFNAVGEKPHVVGFSSSARKDSERNAEASGEFVFNLATWELRDAMNATSAAYDAVTSEPERADVTMTPSRVVAPPRVAASPAALECRYVGSYQLRTLAGEPHENRLVFGQVVGVYVDERFVADGRVATAAMRPIARMGYDEYAVVERDHRLTRPDDRGSRSPSWSDPLGR